MKKPITEIIAFLESHNAWRRGSDDHEPSDPTELGQCIDQAVETLKGMGWQPINTAPKNRPFIGVWGSTESPYKDKFDIFIYDEEKQKFAFSSHGETIYLHDEIYNPWAWMEISKYGR